MRYNIWDMWYKNLIYYIDIIYEIWVVRYNIWDIKYENMIYKIWDMIYDI